jgi:hypothetical protein
MEDGGVSRGTTRCGIGACRLFVGRSHFLDGCVVVVVVVVVVIKVTIIIINGHTIQSSSSGAAAAATVVQSQTATVI